MRWLLLWRKKHRLQWRADRAASREAMLAAVPRCDLCDSRHVVSVRADYSHPISYRCGDHEVKFVLPRPPSRPDPSRTERR